MFSALSIMAIVNVQRQYHIMMPVFPPKFLIFFLLLQILVFFLIFITFYKKKRKKCHMTKKEKMVMNEN